MGKKRRRLAKPTRRPPKKEKLTKDRMIEVLCHVIVAISALATAIIVAIRG